MDKEQIFARRIRDPERPGQFLGYERTAYDGPSGKGTVDRFFRINGAVVEFKEVHNGPEKRRTVNDWTPIDESQVNKPIRKTRRVKKDIVKEDANGVRKVVNEDFDEVYYEDNFVDNPSTMRTVIAGR